MPVMGADTTRVFSSLEVALNLPVMNAFLVCIYQIKLISELFNANIIIK